MSRRRNACHGDPAHGRPSAACATYISMDELLKRVPISRATAYRWIKLGLLPEPVKLGPSRIGFIESEFEECMAGRPRAFGRRSGPKAP
jgi:predicted DNA-binding transcriptional regulator AlpA